MPLGHGNGFQSYSNGRLSHRHGFLNYKNLLLTHTHAAAAAAHGASDPHVCATTKNNRRRIMCDEQV